MAANEKQKKSVSANHIFSTFANVWYETGIFHGRSRKLRFIRVIDVSLKGYTFL